SSRSSNNPYRISPGTPSNLGTRSNPASRAPLPRPRPGLLPRPTPASSGKRRRPGTLRSSRHAPRQRVPLQPSHHATACLGVRGWRGGRGGVAV
ncbi:MAG TPA: hypothetical protein H9867_04415, partial [Candidatus Corynebacterium gallistercoris]|nr:hypothetical protein [Candidatus Corynebacterium gallistercoris]